MGHSVIECEKCGAPIMEGDSDWCCDSCGWYVDNHWGRPEKACWTKYNIDLDQRVINWAKYEDVQNPLSCIINSDLLRHQIAKNTDVYIKTNSSEWTPHKTTKVLTYGFNHYFTCVPEESSFVFSDFNKNKEEWFIKVKMSSLVSFWPA